MKGSEGLTLLQIAEASSLGPRLSGEGKGRAAFLGWGDSEQKDSAEPESLVYFV
jgi:hypothetical protein